MNSRSALRSIAAVVVVSLLVATPGGSAWAQTARMVRPTSLGAGTSGAAFSGSAITGAQLSAPALSLGAATLSAPSIAPSPVALGGAVVAAPSALAHSVISAPAATEPYGEEVSLPHAVRKGPASIEPSKPAPISALNAANANVAPALSAAKNSAPAFEGVRGAMNAFFDGLKIRKPVQDAVSGQDGSEAGKQRLNKHGQVLVPVLVTMSDPGSNEALGLVVGKMGTDVGFRHDDSYEPVAGEGVKTVRGMIPVSRLLALKTYPGVVKIEAATGSMRLETTPSPVSGIVAAAPEASESVMRAGLRRWFYKSPMLASVAVLTLTFGTMVAFMGPVMGGVAFAAAGGAGAWMLGAVGGMAAAYGFLAPLFGFVPLKARAAIAFGAALVASAMLAPAAGLVGTWALANVVVGAIAALRGPASLRVAKDASVLDKALASAESSSYINVIGYSLTVPILAMGGMPALAIGLMIAVSAINVLLLAHKKNDAAPALSTGPPSAPSTPEPGPNKPADSKKAAPAKKPAHAPFVPATRVVAEMEKLFASDKAAGIRAAATALLNEKERRSEVKIGAMRILDQGAFADTRGVYADLLKLASRAGVQTSKEVNIDPWWYLQREALKKFSREIESLKPASPELVDLLKTVYKDRNPSVRLAAAEVLTALGVDPGEEPNYVRAAPQLRLPPSARPENQMPTPSRQQFQNQNKPGSGKWFWILLMAGILGWMTYTNLNRQPAPVRPPVQIEQVQRDSTKAALPDSVTVAPTEKQSLEEIARNTERTAQAVEKQAQAIERQAAATEEMAKPKGMGMGQILMMAAMAILPIFLLVWLLKRAQGGGAAPGGVQMKPKMDLEKPTTRFDDVAGIDETMVEVQEILDFLRDPARFKRLGARMPKGILMEGPPGTGKTLLARALAGETDATFISISGSDFVELYVGMGARRVRELFETARQNAPAIIFIDEIDAVGKKRGDGGPGNGGNDEREQTINQILKEMDGFDNSSGVLVVAATNRADTLDAALTRPGRFDRKIHVGLPEAMGREAILALHAKKARLGPDVDLRLIARRTAGLSGAFLENVINEAALLAARRGGDAINAHDIDEAVDRATIGGKRSLRLSDALKRRIAAHEAGHVLANLLNEKPELRSPVNKVTIIPHGSGALGFAESGGEDGERYLYTRGELEARLDTALGGLIAEKIYYGEWSTGPGSDLESATRVARAMVQQLGMDPDMGLAQTGPNQYGQSAFGSEIDGKAHAAVNKLLKESMERTEKRLRDNKDKHDAMIAALMEKETLGADEIEAMAHPKPKP